MVPTALSREQCGASATTVVPGATPTFHWRAAHRQLSMARTVIGVKSLTARHSRDLPWNNIPTKNRRAFSGRTAAGISVSHTGSWHGPRHQRQDAERDPGQTRIRAKRSSGRHGLGPEKAIVRHSGRTSKTMFPRVCGATVAVLENSHVRVIFPPRFHRARPGRIVGGKAMGSKRQRAMSLVHPNCAGIDVGKSAHYVAVAESAAERPVRTFGSFTADLEAMSAWLRSCGVDIVAMEATGVYWIPLFDELDKAGFDVHLVDARATKQVSGRKSDVLDCQWIRQLMSFGLVKARSARRSGSAPCAPTCASAPRPPATARAACSTSRRSSPR